MGRERSGPGTIVLAYRTLSCEFQQFWNSFLEFGSFKITLEVYRSIQCIPEHFCEELGVVLARHAVVGYLQCAK